MSMSMSMSMSEVFDLPVSVDGFNLNDGYIGGVGGMTIANFDYEFVSTLSASMAEHSAHAINNHDRMVEEIAELKSFVTNLSNSPIHAKLGTKGHSGYEEHLSADWKEGAKDLLAKLNQEGEG